MSDRSPPKVSAATGNDGGAIALPRWALFVGAVALVALLAIDPLVHGHPKFGIDGAFAFYAWYGFGASLALVILAKVVGVFLKRKDAYYD